MLLTLPARAATPFRYVDFKVYDPVYVGIEKGFFARRGLEVMLTGSLLGGPTAIQAVAAGRCEAGLSSIPALVNAAGAGLPVRGVTDIQSAMPGQPLEEYFVREDSPIRNLFDLRGRTFAVNLWKSSFHYTAIMALESAGLYAETPRFVLLPFDKQVQAIAAGQVDVVGLMEPYASYLRAQGGYRVLFSATDVFGAKQFSLHFVNSVWATAHPRAARAFVAGVVESIAWMKAHPAETRKIMAKHIGIEERFVPSYKFQADGRVIMDDVRFWIDYMRKTGDLTATWVGPEDVATNEYNQAVTK